MVLVNEFEISNFFVDVGILPDHGGNRIYDLCYPTYSGTNHVHSCNVNSNQITTQFKNQTRYRVNDDQLDDTFLMKTNTDGT